VTHAPDSHRSLPRALLLALGVLLLAGSLAGLGYTFFRPALARPAATGPGYRQEGTFDYRVHLKPNALSDSTDLGPGGTYFARLVNDVQVSFAYHFGSDAPVQAQGFTYQASALWGAAG